MKKQTIYTFMMLWLFGALDAQSFTVNETYTYSRTYLEPVTYNPANLNANNSKKQVQSVQYTDGLGRPKQDIAIGSTYGGSDMITSYFYDPATGRQTKQYLPITKTSTGGALQTVSEADINNYHGVENAYAEVRTEDSPLSRPVETAAPGDPWKMSGGKTKKTEYLFNGLNEVKKYTAVSDDRDYIFEPTVTQSVYSPNVLNKLVSTDEDGNISVVYKNSMGQTLMTRQDLGTEKLDTYYVYNQYGQLVMIVPPKASDQTLTQDVKEQLCYTYRYDAKGRLIDKRLPGKGREEMVYDKADRLILYRDANMRGQNKWLITKYDLFGRVLYTGFFSGGGDRLGWQTIIMDALVIEQPDGTGFARNGMQILYSNGWFHEMDTVLSVNYYDTYPAGTPAKPTLITETALSSDNLASRSTKTMPTANYVKNISDDRWTRTWYWYDQRGRSIGAQETNHLGGITITHTEQDWAGITKKVETQHQRTANAPVVTVKERFVYNTRNYLEEHYHQVDNRQEELLAKYTYNELGQVTNKEVGNNIQSIDYAYNVRGWLTNINDVTTIGSKLFAYKINYAQRDGLETPNLDFAGYKVQPRYNGNIAETVWQAVDTVGDIPTGTPQRQGYVYDKANRLSAGFYQMPDNPAAKANSEIIEEYDPNGNIRKLKRTGARQKGQVKMIDNLTYDLQGNRLTSVTDAANNLSGYGNGGGAINYDANGNMTAMADKGIMNISYNFLNLAEEIEQTNVTTFYYRADGVKLKKKFVLNNEAGSNVINTEYLDGFVYTTPRIEPLREALALRDPNTVAATHANEEEIFTDPNVEPITQEPADPLGVSLAYFPTAEGYYDYQNNKYIYQYKDHLGNVRLSYAKNSGTNQVEILDRNDYYAFGMNMYEQNSVYDAMGTPLNNKYNQKELQETGFYDYGWRQYMPDLGRWFGMDQLSEKFHSHSPYAYAVNNPVMLYDIDGRDLPGWLQTLWDATKYNEYTTFSGFDSNGTPSSVSFGGSFSAENFTAFVNFLSNGGTGNYTFSTFAGGPDMGSYSNGEQHISMSGVDFHNIKIKAGDFQRGFDEFVYSTDSFFDSVVNYPAGEALGFAEKHLNGGLGTVGMALDGYNKLPNAVKRSYAYKLSKIVPWKSGKIFQEAKALSKTLGKTSKVLGVAGTALTAGNILYEFSSDNWDAHTIVNTGTLVLTGIATFGVGVPAIAAAAPFILGGIALYGLADYAFDLSGQIDKSVGRKSYPY